MNVMSNIVAFPEKFSAAVSQSGKSPCPFLTSQQLEFIKSLRSRMNSNLCEFEDEALGICRKICIDAGYTDLMDKRFAEMVLSPETMDRDELVSILSPVRRANIALLRHFLQDLRPLQARYDLLYQETYIGSVGRDSEYISALKEVSGDLTRKLYRVNQRRQMIKDIDGIISPPDSTRVITALKQGLNI